MKFENHVIIEGRLSKKAVLEKTESGKVFAKASVCFNQFKKLEQPNQNGYNYESVPNFFPIKAWEQNAEELFKINVGDAISIIGQLRYSSWEKDVEKTRKKMKKLQKQLQNLLFVLLFLYEEVLASK